MGRFDESITNYQKALKVDSNFYNSRIGISANYMYEGKYENGSAELKKVYDNTRSDGERRQASFAQMRPARSLCRQDGYGTAGNG